MMLHSAQELHTLLSPFSSACSDFGLTISLKKTKVLSQGTDNSLSWQEYQKCKKLCIPSLKYWVKRIIGHRGSKTWTMLSVQEKKINTYNASVVFLKLDATKDHQQGSVETYWTSNKTAQALLAWSYSENGRRANPKVSAVQLVG